MQATVAGLSDEDWAVPSRCEGWSVKDVVAHIVGVNAFWRASVQAGLSGRPTRMLAGFDPVTTPASMVDAMRALTAGELVEQLESSNDSLLDLVGTIDDEQWSLPAEAPPGHVPIRLVIQHALWDCWVHERDIALVLGLAAPVEPDEVSSGLRYAAALGPSLAVGFGNTLTGVFGVVASDPDVCFSVEIGDSIVVRDCASPNDAPCLRGDAVELVEALSIRMALPPSAPAEWRQLLKCLAAVFDCDPTRVG